MIVRFSKILPCFVFLLFSYVPSTAQQAYFIDGYHGGVYGHYPKDYTQFIVDKLVAHPEWKINLEIEPETWDSVAVWQPKALQSLQKIFADQSVDGRIEYVNPAYGQSYFFNVSGESIIRHFAYGIKKVRQHFPGATFTTYSSEEPCFTTALPQILSSFGYKYASLKNPNTCWGGYTRAYGGELVNWIGPDGSKIVTVPRYQTEGLLANSTWQTEAWINSPKYISKALAYGIKNPVAMTLQDAGWKNGPWIGAGNSGYQPTAYKTWSNYIEHHSVKTPTEDWKFNQEDVLVSLVWGSQVMQRIAQRVRISENKIVAAEKIAALNKWSSGASWPHASIDEAWRNLMLAQHHDCWIVPYNGKRGDTWADKVKTWTATVNRVSDSIIALPEYLTTEANAREISVYNTTGNTRKEWIKLPLPAGADANKTIVLDSDGNKVLAQPVADSDNALYVQAKVPAMSYASYKILPGAQPSFTGATAAASSNGDVVLETDLYRLVLNKAKGGTIKSLVAKGLKRKEFVDNKNERSFNELRGNFFNDGGFHSTADSPVDITVVEQGPAVIKAVINGKILNHPFIQSITLKQGERKIEFSLKIDWQGNVGIGDDYKQKGGLDSKDYHKPFYDDSKKLLALFPVNFTTQKIYKDAPFDVTESKLDNTFFHTWDSIKNNILLHWVDVYDPHSNYGLALLTDHTTSYAHGNSFPLGLNVQYSGTGLWGRNHNITGPTELRYVLIPHRGKWDEASVSTEAHHWNEPLIPSINSNAKPLKNALIDLRGTGYHLVTALVDDADLLVRLYNAEGTAGTQKITFGGSATLVHLEELDGRAGKQLKVRKNKAVSEVELAMPRFGVRTIRLNNFTAF